MPLKLILMNEQILTIHDVPYEDDAFCFDYKHSPGETIFNLSIMFDMFEMLLKQSGEVIKPDPKLIELADSLVEGVSCH